MTNEARLADVDHVVDSSIGFFRRTGRLNRILYYVFGALQTALTVFVPVFALLPAENHPWPRIAAAIAGSAAALVKGLDALWKTRDTWIRCMSTVNRLWNERLLFQASAGKYVGSTDAVAMYAESVAVILGDESQEWVVTARSESKVTGS